MLIATAVRMVEVGSVRTLVRAGRGDAVVLVGTAVATVAFDLVTAVVLGVVAAGAVALRRMARSAVLEQVPVAGEQHDDHHDEEHALLDEHIVAYRLDGPLFFAAAHRALLELRTVSDVRVVILRMSHVSGIDVTGAAVLRDTITQLESHGITVVLSGVRDEHGRGARGPGRHRQPGPRGAPVLLDPGRDQARPARTWPESHTSRHCPSTASVGERLDQGLLEVADPLVDVVRLGPRVLVRQRGPDLLVVLLDLEPGGQREADVGEGPQPGLGGRLVELDVEVQAVLGQLGRQPGLLEGVDDGDRATATCRRAGSPR